jgi:hypothetical protein
MRQIADHPIDRIEDLLPWKLAPRSPSNGNGVHNLAIVDTIGE